MLSSLQAQIANAEKAAEEVARIKELEKQAAELENLRKLQAQVIERQHLQKELDLAIQDAKEKLPALAEQVQVWREKVKALDKLLGEVQQEQEQLHNAITTIGDSVVRTSYTYNATFFVVPSPYTGRTTVQEFTGGVSLPAMLNQAGLDNAKLRVALAEGDASLELRKILQTGKRYYYGTRAFY